MDTINPTPTTAADLVSAVQSGAMTQQDFDQAIAGLHASPQPAPQAAGSIQSASETAPIISAGDLSASDTKLVAQDMKNWLQDGTISQADYDAYFADNPGVTPIQEDTRTVEAKEIDAAFPLGAPESFVFPSYELKDGETMPPAMKEFDTQARAALAEARFTQETGTSLAREISRVATEHARMSDAEKQLYRAKQDTILRNLWGDQYAKNLSETQAFYRELSAKYPKVAQVIERVYAGNSARVIVALHNQGSVLLARKGHKQD